MGLIEELQKERGRLEKAKNWMESSKKGTKNYKKNEREWSLQCSTMNGKNRYYLYDGESEKKYLSQKECKIIRDLSQSEYEKRLKKCVDQELVRLIRLQNCIMKNSIDDVYEKMHPGKQKYIQPVEPSKYQIFEDWKNRNYQGKGFAPDAVEIYSNNGERVRSKSEKILADMFLSKGIPYKYECPLELRDRRIVYPDFTFWDIENQREIYWEHDGRMDDPEYAEKAVRKIDGYVQSGILLGEQLIITYETSGYPLNGRVVEILVEKHLLGRCNL
jgi:hypothetical protein